MHPLAIFILAAPVIGLIFLSSLLLNILLTRLAGWSIGKTLAAVWVIWMAAAAALQFAMGGDVPFSIDTYVLELVIAAVGFLPAVAGAWLGARSRRRHSARP